MKDIDYLLVGFCLMIIGAFAYLHYSGNTAYVACISKGEHTLDQCVELTK